jgi:hypothetical protein
MLHVSNSGFTEQEWLIHDLAGRLILRCVEIKERREVVNSVSSNKKQLVHSRHVILPESVHERLVRLRIKSVASLCQVDTISTHVNVGQQIPHELIPLHRWKAPGLPS